MCAYNACGAPEALHSQLRRRGGSGFVPAVGEAASLWREQLIRFALTACMQWWLAFTSCFAVAGEPIDCWLGGGVVSLWRGVGELRQQCARGDRCHAPCACGFLR